jgi:2-polyprenyl-6-methoxyphenol hydroxylase-like FAD-dependent oxidoreductase
MTPPKRSHAIVVGSGMAGLCAVRALSDQFERVTLVERDRLPDGFEHRAGTPQSHHVHALLLRGSMELERLFPGLESELIAGGAARMDLSNDFAHCTEWGWATRGPSRVAPLTLSRVMIEGAVRARVLGGERNLTLLQDTRVTGLLTEREGDRLRVTGITTSRGEQREIRAELVVDASGRNSKCLEWLEAHEVARPEESLVDSYAGYASRFYELAPNPRRWWRGMLITPRVPAFPRWGLLMPIENGRCVLTLGGVNREYPPNDEQGFREHLDKLASPALAREIDLARPLSSIHSNRSLFNRARHFERWPHEVAGFVSLGDSAVTFNPNHGQGMSMAALAANILGDVCASRVHDPYALTRRFHRAQWKALRTAWDIATGADMEWPGTCGKRPFAYNLSLVLGTVVCRAAAEYPRVMGLTGPVYQLLAPPFSLLRPEMIARVIYAEIRRRLGRTAPLPPPEDSSAIYLPAPNTPASTPPQWRKRSLPEPAAAGTRVDSGA